MDVNRPFEPGYAGLGTFAKLPLILDADELAASGADVVILGAPTDELVTNRPGARFGPRAVRLGDYNYGTDRPNMDVGLDPMEVLKVIDHGDIVPSPGYPLITHGDIREAVKRIRAADAIPLIIGGDHSIAHPDVGAVSEVLGPESLGLIHFDAHADDAWEEPRLSHGTPMRLLVEEGALHGKNIVQVGLRGYWPPPSDFEWAREQGFRWHLMDEIYHRGIEPVIDDVITEMGELGHVFLSIDVDVCDPAFAPGTGTPEPGGLQARELLRAVRRLCTDLPIAGMEVVEVSPPYDHADITAYLANRVILEALSGIALRKEGQSPSPEIGS